MSSNKYTSTVSGGYSKTTTTEYGGQGGGGFFGGGASGGGRTSNSYTTHLSFNNQCETNNVKDMRNFCSSTMQYGAKQVSSFNNSK